MFTILLQPSKLITIIENLYSLKGIKSLTAVVLTLPRTLLKGDPVARNTSISIAIGDDPVNLVSQERDTSLSLILDTTRLVTGSGGRVKKAHTHSKDFKQSSAVIPYNIASDSIKLQLTHYPYRI